MVWMDVEGDELLFNTAGTPTVVTRTMREQDQH